MEESGQPLSQRAESSRETQQLIVQHGGPAFIRRARAAETAWQDLLASLAIQRGEMLDMVRLRVGVLLALAEPLENWFDDGVAEQIRALERETKPQLRMPVEPATSRRPIDAAMADLAESIARFNRRWRKRVESVDLSHINRLRDEHNRFYLIEKEFAVGSAAIARRNYTPMPPATHDDVLRESPVLRLNVM